MRQDSVVNTPALMTNKDQRQSNYIVRRVKVSVVFQAATASGRKGDFPTFSNYDGITHHS